MRSPRGMNRRSSDGSRSAYQGVRAKSWIFSILSDVSSMKAGGAESLVSLLELAAVSAGASVLPEDFSCAVQARRASRWVLKPCFHPQARVHAKCGKSCGSDITWPSIGTAIPWASTICFWVAPSVFKSISRNKKIGPYVGVQFQPCCGSFPLRSFLIRFQRCLQNNM